jgi:uncharacterized protein (DUF2384 family)
MGMITGSIHFEGADKIPGREVSAFVHRLSKYSGLPDKTLAQSVFMSEALLNRLAAGRADSVRAQTILPLKRVATLIEEALDTLTPAGARAWLVTPNPYLHEVPPIQCLRSDKELERVLALLAAVRHGYPA